jgi:ATP citrate (pro-S)-lyase
MIMFSISKLRKIEPKIIALGSYPPILQSIIDFDYLSGKKSPSLVGILASGRKSERYFWGKKEIIIPVFQNISDFKKDVNLFLNLTSGRRVLESTLQVFDYFPNIFGGVIFAENVPEKDAISLIQKSRKYKKFIIGPASVGILIPQKLKLGPIGGVTPTQQIKARLFETGKVAVFSSSGGMVNEIINILAQKRKGISFALSFGAERFPILSPKEAFLAAESDKNTSFIVYFGELGGYDEYEVAELLQKKLVKKPVICYIAGFISEMFKTPPQFGHAKAIAKRKKESAREKMKALKKAGAKVANNFSEFLKEIEKIESTIINRQEDLSKIGEEIEKRKPALFISSISEEEEGEVKILGKDLVSFAKNHTFAEILVSLFLGREIKSKILSKFVDFILKLLVDHGPGVSGAVNTIIASRAGKDLVSSLVSGLLTIGPRFGGAINEAAKNWLSAIEKNINPFDFVEEFALKKYYIAGIGHRKYRIDLPDPRVKEILSFASYLKEKRFTQFALAVEKITTSKKGNLILNVDGAIAAVLLDILYEKEKISLKELKELTEIEFFNAFFVLSRSVGLIAHFLDQKRIDEGLFRLTPDLISKIKPFERKEKKF